MRSRVAPGRSHRGRGLDQCVNCEGTDPKGAPLDKNSRRCAILKPSTHHGSRDIPGQTTVENLSLWRDKSKY